MSRNRLLGFVAAIASVAAFILLNRPPAIGDAKEYDSFWLCHRGELVVPSTHGIIAAMRRVDCTIYLGPYVADYFVFIHTAHEADSPENLAVSFSRVEDDNHRDIAPAVIWRTPATLWVGSGNRAQVHVYRSSLAGVHVEYQLGREIVK